MPGAVIVSDRVPWHLPGLPDRDRRDSYQGETTGGWRFETPRLTAEDAAVVAQAVRGAGIEARTARSLAEVVTAVASAAGRLAEPTDLIGREALQLLGNELGWSSALAAETLAGMGEIWSPEALERVLADELPDPRVLDAYRPAGSGRRRRASGPPLLFIVQAGNVPGVAITAAIRGLLVRSGVLCKTAEGEPGLLPLFCHALAESDPVLGASLAASWWPSGGDAPASSEWIDRSGRAVVYGGEEAVSSVRDRLAANQDLVIYGPGLGVGVVLEDGGSEEDAAGLARDVCAYDHSGCVSPRIVYVLGDADRFATTLADALATETSRIELPRPSPEEAIALRDLRAGAEFGPAAREEVEVYGDDEALAWTVLRWDVSLAEAEALPRLVWVCGVEDMADLARRLKPAQGRIQAIGYAGSRKLDRLAELAARDGVSRLAPFGTVAWPPADWRHEGRQQLLPLLDWTDWEGRPPERLSSESA